MLAESDRDPIRERCRAVLASNWREGHRAADGVPFAYTCPSPGHYPWQWYWDSCFTAVSWRRFDRERSRRELESLLAAQREDGFIGHTIFWNEPLRGSRRLTYNVPGPNALMTASIQPPALAWAWQIAVGDPGDVPAIHRATTNGWPSIATSTATACSGWCSRMSRDWMPLHSSTRCGDAGPTARRGSCCS